MTEPVRHMQYNGRCGCHFMRPVQTLDVARNIESRVDPETSALPAVGKTTFYMSKNKHGLRKDFDYEGPVVFNNPYRQTLDESGKPLLRNIFSGAFQSTDQPDFLCDQGSQATKIERTFDVLHEKRFGKRTNIPKPCNVDISRNIPLMQSTLNGAYYGEAGDVQKYFTHKPSLLQKYRRSVADYSSIVKSIKPTRQFTNRNQLSSNALRKSIADIPTTEEEVMDFYEGRPTTQTATVMAQYLANCSAKEKMRFTRAVRAGSQDNKISSAVRSRSHPEGAGLIPVRAQSQNSAIVETSYNSDGGIVLTENEGSATSVAKVSHQQALNQAKNMVRSRGLQQNSRDLNSVRPASVSEMASVSLPISCSPVRIARRGGDTMHKDLQVSAFGATFASCGLSSLESILKK
jgi:hypothetical protein